MTTKTIAIKAGSSVFKDHLSFGDVADLLRPLARHYDQIYFVVSAVDGETNRTIAQLARQKAEQTGLDAAVLAYALDQGLRNNPQPQTELFNNENTARQLVLPEEYSVSRLVVELQGRGIDAIGIRHGPTDTLLGVDNNNFLYATPDIAASRKNAPRYNAKVIVVPGFAVRNARGQIMCTGRGSSDLTVVQMAEAYNLPEVVYWKDEGGVYDPQDAKKGIKRIIPFMTREEARTILSNAKVLDTRVYDFSGAIRVTEPGKTSGGTLIAPPISLQYRREENPYISASAK